MRVYVVFHLYGENGYTICGICCTEKQASNVCKHHPAKDGMTGMTYRAFPLHGFPYAWLAIGLGFAAATVVTRLL